jgi:hypothetical protein
MDALVIAPSNVGFFALGLALLQGIVPTDQILGGFAPRAIIYVAPVFRHTHFDGKQVVVHNRREGLHELFSYNLYPGPSAKKGIYGVLLGLGEREGWVTAHCSTVQVITPYDNVATIMRHILCPNQHVGAWRVGFMPQWIAREYLARRGMARFRPEQLVPARSPLLGNTLRQLQVEGRMIATWFLRVDSQPEVGAEAYDRGAAILHAFFRKCLADFQDPDLDPLGKEIIACCLDNGTLEDYERLIPAE